MTSAFIQSALQAIYDRDGKLTAEAVIAEASDPDSPLHGQFEWDDVTAGHSWRLTQARRLIARCRIVVETSPEKQIKVRAFTHVRSEGTYMPTAEVLRSDHREEVLAQCRRDLAQLRAKYELLVDFDSVLREHLNGGDGSAPAAG